jgi:quercetin dioxygenase-like cupin family protein
MFRRNDADEPVPALEGVWRKTLAHGERTLLTEFHLTCGHVLPRHTHPHEQVGYLVRGRLRLSIGAEVFDARPGDAWCVPGGVEHGAEILEDSIAVEVFSPVREDYLPKGA